GPLRIWRDLLDQCLQSPPFPCHGLCSICANTLTVSPLQSMFCHVTVKKPKELFSCGSTLKVHTERGRAAPAPRTAGRLLSAPLLLNCAVHIGCTDDFGIKSTGTEKCLSSVTSQVAVRQRTTLSGAELRQRTVLSGFHVWLEPGITFPPPGHAPHLLCLHAPPMGRATQFENHWLKGCATVGPEPSGGPPDTGAERNKGLLNFGRETSSCRLKNLPLVVEKCPGVFPETPAQFQAPPTQIHF
ncbi:unnamed protein product, partial [Pleuronectes platessa]